jgi:hypothetical protein
MINLLDHDVERDVHVEPYLSAYGKDQSDP